MVKDSQWNTHEIIKLYTEAMNNTSSDKIVKKFRDDSECSNRSNSDIEHKQREWNLPFIREVTFLRDLKRDFTRDFSIRKELEDKNEELEDKNEELEDKNEELEEALLNEKSKMSKISYNHNETNVYHIELIDSLEEKLGTKNTLYELLEKELKNKEEENYKLKKDVVLVSKIRDGKVIIFPSYLIYICFLLYFHSFFFSLLVESIHNVFNIFNTFNPNDNGITISIFILILPLILQMTSAILTKVIKYYLNH